MSEKDEVLSWNMLGSMKSVSFGWVDKVIFSTKNEVWDGAFVTEMHVVLTWNIHNQGTTKAKHESKQLFSMKKFAWGLKSVDYIRKNDISVVIYHQLNKMRELNVILTTTVRGRGNKESYHPPKLCNWIWFSYEETSPFFYAELEAE